MSEELTKLAKLANSAAGDSDLELKLNTSLASPKMRALHLKDEIGPLGPPGPPPGPGPGGMKMEDKIPMKMELGGKNSSQQGMMRMDHMKGGMDGVVGMVMKKEEDDSVFLRDGQMNQINNQMNNQMMSNGPQDDKGNTTTLIYICPTQRRWCKWVPGRN